MQDENPDRHHNQPPPELALPILPGDATPEQVARKQEAAKPPEPVKGNIAYDKDKHAELEAHVQVFCDAAGKWLDLETIQSEEQAQRLADFMTGADQLFERVENARKAAKKPWDDLAKAVQEAYRPFTGAPAANFNGGKLTLIRKSMKGMSEDWLRREKTRIAQERKEEENRARALREAAEKAAQEAAQRNDISGQYDAEQTLKEAHKAEKRAAKPVTAKMSSSTGAGRSRGLRKTKHAKVINKRACFAFFQNDPAVEEVLTRLATAAVRSGALTKETEKLAGVESYETEGSA